MLAAETEMIRVVVKNAKRGVVVETEKMGNLQVTYTYHETTSIHCLSSIIMQLQNCQGILATFLNVAACSFLLLGGGVGGWACTTCCTHCSYKHVTDTRTELNPAYFSKV